MGDPFDFSLLDVLEDLQCQHFLQVPKGSGFSLRMRQKTVRLVLFKLVQLKIKPLVHFTEGLQEEPATGWHIQVSLLLQVESLLQTVRVRPVYVGEKGPKVMLFVISVPKLLLDFCASTLHVKLEVSTVQMS